MKKLLVGTTLLISFIAFPVSVIAQNTQTVRGIEQHMDGHGRSPQFSVTRVNKGDGIVSLLIDGFNPDKEYNRLYPTIVEVFINRHSYVRQVRYPGLFGPLGVDVNTAQFPLPFNYVVFFQTLTPNRTFTSSLSGAFFSTNLVSELDCEITLSSAIADGETTFSASDVSTSQSGDSDLVLSFTGVNSDGDEILVSGVVSIDNASNSASSTLRLVRNEIPQLIATTGEVTTDEDDGVASISLNANDGSVQLECDS